MNIHNTIVETALKYVGQKEIPGNMGFIDKKFQELMEIVGWKPTYAWCALFCELIYKEAYSRADSSMIVTLDGLFSAGAVQTFVNFKNEGWVIEDTPIPGAIAVWQTYRNGQYLWTGHQGIVISTDMASRTFRTVDGNTSPNDGREGEMVRIVSSHLLKPRGSLRLRGFIYPMNV